MIRSGITDALVLPCLLFANVFAQSLPATDLWLAKIVNDLPLEPEK